MTRRKNVNRLLGNLMADTRLLAVMVGRHPTKNEHYFPTIFFRCTIPQSVAGVTTGSEYEKMFVANTPLGRRGQPEDIAKAAVFVASDDAAWITGEQISVSGGMYGF